MAIDFLDSSCEANIAENFRRVENDIGGVLPEIEEGDSGKVLSVNNAETGVEWVTPSGGGGVLVVTATYDSETGIYTLDKTAGEIYAACPLVVMKQWDEQDEWTTVSSLRGYALDESGYLIVFRSGNTDISFYATSADDYPTDVEPGDGEDE